MVVTFLHPRAGARPPAPEPGAATKASRGVAPCGAAPAGKLLERYYVYVYIHGFYSITGPEIPPKEKSPTAFSAALLGRLVLGGCYYVLYVYWADIN